MKYIGSALRYMFKNFIFVFLFALIPSYFFAMTVDTDNARVLTQELISADGGVTFAGLFTFFSPVNAGGWPYALVCLAALAVSLPFLFGFIEKHMRIGKRSFNGAFSRLNDNIVSSFFVTLLYCAIYELWSLVTAAVLYAFGALVLNAVGVYILSLLFFIGLIYALLFVVSVFYLWLPCLQITGFRAYDALRYSYQLVSNIRGKLILAQALSLLTANIVVGLSAIYLPALPFQIITFVVFLLLFAEFCVRMEVAYFETENLDREDLLRSYREL